MRLAIREENKSPWTIVHLLGRIDVMSAQQLDEFLNKCCFEGSSHLALNFENVNYLSSSGLRVLLLFHKRFRELNRNFELIQLPKHIYEIITVAGFDKVFSVFKDYESMRNR